MGWGTWLPQYTLLRGLSESHQLFNNFQTTFVTKFYKCAHSKRFGGFANFCQHETWQYVSVKGPQSLNQIKPLNIICCFPLFFCCKALKKSCWFLNWFLPLGASKKSWLFLICLIMSKCQSNCQNVNQIVKMSITFSKCQSNCQNVSQIVKLSQYQMTCVIRVCRWS